MTSPTPGPSHPSGTPGAGGGTGTGLSSAASSTQANKKADQIVHRFYVKAALLLAQARESQVQVLPAVGGAEEGYSDREGRERERTESGAGRGRKPDKWFNIETPDTPPPSLLPLLAAYRSLSISPTPSPQLTILTLLLIPPLSPSQLLVLHPPPPSPSSSTSSSSDPEDTPSLSAQVLSPSPRAIVLERWTLDLLPLSASQSLPSPSHSPTRTAPAHPTPTAGAGGGAPVPGSEDEPLQRVYKRGISLFRAHFQLLRQLPAWGVMRRLRSAGAGVGEGGRGGYAGGGGMGMGGGRGRGRAEEGVAGLRMVLRREGEERGVLDFDALATLVSPSPRTATQRLSPVPTPHGQLNISCTYLVHPHFALANKESLLSATFITQDRRAASRSQQRRHATTAGAGEEGAYDDLDASTISYTHAAPPGTTAAGPGGDDGLTDPLPPSLPRFSSSPDTAARLLAQAQGHGHGGSLGSSPGSLSLRAQAALHASQSRGQSSSSLLPVRQPPEPYQPPAQPQPAGMGSMYSSVSFTSTGGSGSAGGGRRPESPTSPTRAPGSPRGGYFASLPSGRDLPFAVGGGGGGGEPTAAREGREGRERERERERERKVSLLSNASVSSVDLPLPAPNQPRRPSLNAPHPFKPPSKTDVSDLSGSSRMGGSAVSSASSGPGAAGVERSVPAGAGGGGAHGSHPPSPLAAYAPRQLGATSSSSVGQVVFPSSVDSTEGPSAASPGGAGPGGGTERPPMRSKRYSSSFGHRYSSGSNSGASTSAAGAGAGAGALSTTAGAAGGGTAGSSPMPMPIGIRQPGSAGSPSLLARSLRDSASLSQSQLAGSYGAAAAAGGGSYGSRGGGVGSYGSRTSFGGREGREGAGGRRVESVPEGEVPDVLPTGREGGGSLAASAMGSIGGSGSGSGSGSGMGSGVGAGAGATGEAAAGVAGRGGGRRYSSSFGQRRPVLTTAGSSTSGGSASSAPGHTPAGQQRTGSAGSGSELPGISGLTRPGSSASPSSGPLPQRMPTGSTPQVDDPDLLSFLQMLDSGPRLSGSPGGSGLLAQAHQLAGSGSPRPSSLSSVSLGSTQHSTRQGRPAPAPVRTGTLGPTGAQQGQSARDAQITALEARHETSLRELTSPVRGTERAAGPGPSVPSGISRLRQAEVASPDPFAQDDDEEEEGRFDPRVTRPRAERTTSDELVVGRLEQGEPASARAGAGGRAAYARSGSRGTERAESRDPTERERERGERGEGRGWRKIPSE